MGLDFFIKKTKGLVSTRKIRAKLDFA